MNVGLRQVSDFGTTSCASNCSGHGVCQQEQCLCLLQYSGQDCDEANPMYYFSFGSIFTFVGFVATIQLFLCIVSEYYRNKDKSWRSAFGVTVQKLLYILVICASSLRGAYFFSKWRVSEYVASCLWCAYFPFLITGFSLIICSWAEDVHVNRTETPRFLSKSVLAFVLFNVTLYLVVCAVLVVTDIVPNKEVQDFSLKAYNGAVAVLFIILVVIFLIYGVELYFKIHGAFANLDRDVELDPVQVAMSRLGLLSQALLQFLMGLLLVADVLTDHWKNVLSVLEQNYYEVVFRVVEFGVVLWFPCVLWNYRQPEQLWVLNPRRILRSLKFHSGTCGERTPLHSDDYTIPSNYNTFHRENSSSSEGCQYDCWICYDPDRKDAGPLLQPCECRGDVATVHHNCLQKWLIESSELGKTPRCNVCNRKYRLQRVSTWVPRSMGSRHLAVLLVLLVSMLGSPVLSYFVCHSKIGLAVKVLVTGGTVIFELFALKILSMTLSAIYSRVRVASMRILGKELDTKTVHRRPEPHKSSHTTSQPRGVTGHDKIRTTRDETSSHIKTQVEIHVTKTSNDCDDSDNPD